MASLLPMGVAAAFMALPSLALAAAKDTTKKAVEFVLEDGSLWRQLFSEEQGKPYYYNVKSGATQWNDPRRAASSAETFTTFLIFMLPFVLMVLAGGGYLLYVRIAHPDVFKGPKKGKGKYIHSLAKAAKKPAKDTDATAAAAAPTPALTPEQEKKIS